MEYQKLQEAASFLEKHGFTDITTAVVLGTGLSKLLEKIQTIKMFTYQEIPHFPEATVESHHGRMVLAQCGDNRVVIYQGRFHQYEGYSMHQVVFPARLARMLGAKELLLSNAAGALNPAFRKGDLVLIDDHINMQTLNPLTGTNITELGPRFPDMSAPYHGGMRERLRGAAKAKNVALKEGVYVAVNGPNLETRAEYRYLRRIGADMVGMSTVPEVIASVHMGMPCAAVSVITDECDPDHLKPTDISEIIAAAKEADTVLSEIFAEFLRSKPATGPLG